MADADDSLEESRVHTRVAIVSELVRATLEGRIKWAKEALPITGGTTTVRYSSKAAGLEASLVERETESLERCRSPVQTSFSLMMTGCLTCTLGTL